MTINLLLNRASPWVDIYSHIPFEGQVDLKIKVPCRSLLVHAPEWIGADSGTLTVLINNQPTTFSWEGRYVRLEKIEQGSTVAIKFPISEWTAQETMSQAEYMLTMKGNSVVAISPTGQNGPLYQRELYRLNQTLWRQMSRFVSAEPFNWIPPQNNVQRIWLNME